LRLSLFWLRKNNHPDPIHFYIPKNGLKLPEPARTCLNQLDLFQKYTKAWLRGLMPAPPKKCRLFL